jgi:hypothetical protein
MIDAQLYLKLSEYDKEEQKLRKLYDQARVQGDRKKKKQYKEMIVELNRRKKLELRKNAREAHSE